MTVIHLDYQYLQQGRTERSAALALTQSGCQASVPEHRQTGPKGSDWVTEEISWGPNSSTRVVSRWRRRCRQE